MIIDWLNRNLAHPLAAIKNRSRHLEFLKRLERCQFDPPSVVRGRQLAQLKLVLRHAYDSVPFYKRTWDAADVHPDDVKTLDDLKHVPLVTKADLRTRGDEFLSDRYDRSKLITKRTSGSTGVPLTIRIDEAGKQWKAAATIRADQWSGYRLGQRVAKVWGNPEYRQFGLRGRLRNRFLDRAVYLDTLSLDDGMIASFVETLKRKPPGLLFGHAHSLHLLAKRLKSDGVTDIRPGGIVTTAMPLHSWQRETLNDVFGVMPCDRYGCEEVSLIAAECEAHAGLHENADSVYCEIEGGGDSGPLLVTDLSNFAMPLIRYRVGDVVTRTTGDAVCTCGRGLPRLASVQGREADFVVTPSGRLISGISLTENFALHIPGTAQVQIVQETVHHLRIRIVPDECFGPQSRTQIQQLVNETFGATVRHDVELIDAIPQEASGKYRFCISHVAKDELRAAA